MKKGAAIACAVIAALVLAYFIGTGFLKVSSAHIVEYSVSADGREITLQVSVSTSMGYIRKAAVHQQGGGKLYIDFYSAFGGLNGSIGAKTRYTLPLDEDTEIIAVYRGENCYEEALRKDGDGVWRRVK